MMPPIAKIKIWPPFQDGSTLHCSCWMWHLVAGWSFSLLPSIVFVVKTFQAQSCDILVTGTHAPVPFSFLFFEKWEPSTNSPPSTYPKLPATLKMNTQQCIKFTWHHAAKGLLDDLSNTKPYWVIWRSLRYSQYACHVWHWWTLCWH